MSRVSDTRLRTREAAAQLVSTGRRSHDLTVDLIYAEIKQGSRTTINDELKLWKDEQAKANALTAALPPAVASAMLNMWALAVEHGEKAFDLRLEEVETHLAKATTSVESLGAEKCGLLQQNESLQAEIARGQSELAAVRELLTAEHVAKENATSRVDALEQQLESVKTDAAQAISIVKAEHRLSAARLADRYARTCRRLLAQEQLLRCSHHVRVRAHWLFFRQIQVFQRGGDSWSDPW